MSSLIYSIETIDFPLWLNNETDSCLYSDDNYIYVSSMSLENAIQKVEIESVKVIRFFNSNKLALNPQKSTAIIFRPNGKREKEVTLKIGDALINESHCVQILGVVCDNKLDINIHVESPLKSKVWNRSLL